MLQNLLSIILLHRITLLKNGNRSHLTLRMTTREAGETNGAALAAEWCQAGGRQEMSLCDISQDTPVYDITPPSHPGGVQQLDEIRFYQNG